MPVEDQVGVSSCTSSSSSYDVSVKATEKGALHGT